jgi:hypothetical protein
MKKTSKALIVITLLGLVSFGYVIQINLFWTSQIVAPNPGAEDVLGRGGIDKTFLTFDKNGNPQIYYSEYLYPSGSAYGLASYNGFDWTVQNIDPQNWVTIARIVGSTAVTYDSNGDPRIFYEDDFSFKYGVWNGSGFDDQIVNSSDNYQIVSSSLALDLSNKPYICYLESVSSKINIENYSFTSNDEKLM